MPGEENISDVTVRILRQIRDEARSTNERLVCLTVEVCGGFERLSGRIDNVLLGEHGEEHHLLRRRVARLEAHLELPPLTPGSG